MFCPNCGAKANEGDKFCRSCGAKLNADGEPIFEGQPDTAAQIPPQGGQYDRRTDDVYRDRERRGGNGENAQESAGWAVLGFFFPLVGLILYLIWYDDHRRRAKLAGKGALIGVITEVVFFILWFVIAMVISMSVM